MDKYMTTQVFTVAVALILALIFYMLLLANVMTQYQQYQSFLTPLLLIIIAIIILAIFSLLSKIASQLERRR